LRITEVTSFSGRNAIWAGPTSAGRQVFVKRISGEPDSAARRLRRSLNIEHVGLDVPIPRCLGWDEASRFMAFDLVDDARSGHDLAEDGRFDDELARRMGALIGQLHGADHADLTLADSSPPDLPPVGWLHALPPDVYADATAAELQLWRLLQSDQDLIAALTRLRTMEEKAPRVAAHCDLRLVQFLVTPRRIYLTDWEEFRAADPARDVGSYAGEWLYRAIAAVPVVLSDAIDLEPSHEQIVAACVTELDRRRPAVRAFWHAYQTQAVAIDSGLAERAAGFAGWHVIDRVMVAAERRALIGAVDRAALGIARMVLLRPGSAAGLLGLEGSA
jgi:aminoglycoside phosphotransferase (APT) family kinase protein